MFDFLRPYSIENNNSGAVHIVSYKVANRSPLMEFI